MRKSGVIAIDLATTISAPIGRVFDLARSIDAHVASTDGTSERAVAGRTSGLIGLGETVTWEARHLGVTQRLTVKITAFDRPHRFVDEMVAGAFKSMRHVHTFTETAGATEMRDRFEFSAPGGPLGWLVERVVLRAYMRRLLERRNQILKRLAESDQWRRLV